MLLLMEEEPRFIDPNKNLLEFNRGFKNKSWILPFNDEIKGFSILFLSFAVFGQDKTKIRVLIDDKSFDYKNDQRLNIYNSESGLIGSEKIGITFEVELNKYPTKLFLFRGTSSRRDSCKWSIQRNYYVIMGSALKLNEVVLKPKRKSF